MANLNSFFFASFECPILLPCVSVNLSEFLNSSQSNTTYNKSRYFAEAAHLSKYKARARACAHLNRVCVYTTAYVKDVMRPHFTLIRVAAPDNEEEQEAGTDTGGALYKKQTAPTLNPNAMSRKKSH